MSRRVFYGLLAGILVLGLAARLLLLAEFLQDNPLARVPLSDAAEYWRWAGRIASGELVGNTPFLSAPLYPYVLALIRAVGGGLTAVYFAQLVVHLATAICIGWLGRVRFGATVGLVGAGLFLLLAEPAFVVTRLLHSTLQLALVGLLWVLLVRVQRRPSLIAYAGAGAALGLNCLANPPMLLLLPLGAVWTVLQPGRGARRLARAGVLVATAALLVATATIHNWLACREFIPITAHAGITFRQGNTPASTGIYTPLAGISAGRHDMHEDAARLYERQTGQPPRWRDVDRYFRNQGFAYWRSNPLEALRLAATKLYLFLTGRNYGDIYLLAAEIEYGLATWLARVAPARTAWLIGPALVGLVVMLRRPLRYGPELMLFAIPLFVVMVFWYSPRYRAPAIPVVAVAAAWTFVRAVQWRSHWGWSIAAVAALGASIGLGFVNQATSFDPLRPRVERVGLQVAHARVESGDLGAGIAELREGLRPGRPALELRTMLASYLGRAGRVEEAYEEYLGAAEFHPDHVEVLRGLAQTLLTQRRVAEAEQVLRRAAALHPEEAFVPRLTQRARRMRAEVEGVVESYRRVLERAPDRRDARLALGKALMLLGRWNEARQQFEAVLQSAPDDFEAHCQLADLFGRLGHLEAARRHGERALRIQPRATVVLYRLAKLCVRFDRLEEATAYFRRVLALDPEHGGARRALRRLQKKLEEPPTEPAP
jgi:tetratricopeptide (TPR) repeat protein